MAISALMPLLIDGPQLSVIEKRSFLRAALHVQHVALTVDSDPHEAGARLQPVGL